MTTLAPIFTGFSRKVVSDQDPTTFGGALVAAWQQLNAGGFTGKFTLVDALREPTMRVPVAILVLTALACVVRSDRAVAAHHSRDRPAPERLLGAPLRPLAVASMTLHGTRSQRLVERHSGPRKRPVSTGIPTGIATDAGEAVVPDIRSCSPTMDCTDHLVLQDAIDASRPGYTVTLAPRSYRQCAVVKVDELTIIGRGAHLRGRACGGKAALVIKGRGVTVDGLECSDITVPDRNGACIRIEAPDLTVRGVYFHDNENGVLGGRGGTVTIEDSLFERNGRAGRAHGVYISKKVDLFVFRNNRVLSTKGEGHGLKSRARRSVIEGNVIAGLEGLDSRAIDLPNGGNNVIRDNVLEKGRNSSNHDLIGIALEARKGKRLHKVNVTVIQGNTMLCDLGRRCRLVHSAGEGSVEFYDNVIVGPTFEFRDNLNRWFSNRAAARLPEAFWRSR